MQPRIFSVAGAAVLACALAAVPVFSQAPARNNPNQHPARNPVLAQPAPPNNQNPAPNVNQQHPMAMLSMQAQLISRIHQMSQMGIQAGRMAMTNSQNSRVREFGQRMVIDYAAADRAVLHYARRHGIALVTPTTTNPQDQQQMQAAMATMQKLQTVKGPAFDRQFVQFMQDAHYNAIHMLAQQESTLPRSGLKSMVRDMIPIMAQEYDVASNLNVREAANGMQGGY